MLVLRLAPLDALLSHATDMPDAHWLSEHDQQRQARFGSAQRARQFRAGRWLLRQMLFEVGVLPRRDAPAVQLLIGSEGAPRLAQVPGWELSISHSGAWVGCALATRRVGLDIEHERPRSDLAGLAAMVGLGADATAGDLGTAWTLKEAALKHDGRALDLGLLPRLRADPAPATQANALSWRAAGTGLHIALVSEAMPQLCFEPPPDLDCEAARHWKVSLPSALGDSRQAG
ncbi:MAG: hypothetical protein RLZZ598_1146 [Pseudomonadota bacterium]|jgi:4'-phosphopantetheinyl transferase